jgi:hypothetical protein
MIIIPGWGKYDCLRPAEPLYCAAWSDEPISLAAAVVFMLLICLRLSFFPGLNYPGARSVRHAFISDRSRPAYCAAQFLAGCAEELPPCFWKSLMSPRKQGEL